MGADLETGMYYGGGNRTTVNNQSIPLPFDFVTGSVKGRTDGFTIKGESRVERGTLVSIFCCMHICTILCDRFTNPTKLRTAAAIPSEPVCVGGCGAGADATKGTLTTMYDGPRPYYPQGPSWQPMRKQASPFTFIYPPFMRPQLCACVAELAESTAKTSSGQQHQQRVRVV
jgi:hypothetical protein